MTPLTRPQALALLDQLRAELAATDAVHVSVEWHPGLLAVHVADHRRGPPYRLVEILQGAEGTAPPPRTAARARRERLGQLVSSWGTP